MNRTLIALPASLILAACSPGSVSSTDPIGPGGGGDVGMGPDAAPLPTDGRAVAGLQALYRFQDGAGAIVSDVSNTGDALDLEILDLGSVSWIPGGGLNVTAPTTLVSNVIPRNLVTSCQASGAITMEAWVKSNDVGQNGRVLALSNGDQHNFELSQTGDLGELRAYVHTTDEENQPVNLAAPPAFNGNVRHIVYTRDGLDDTASIFIEGQRQLDETVAGGMGNWGLDNYQISLANDPDNDAEWRGEFYLIAVYCRALSASEVFQNYEAGY